MSQTVYFDNPSTITQLQTLVGTTPAFNIAGTTANLNQYLYGPVKPFQPSTTLPFLKVATGALASQDAQGKTCLNWAGLVGNAFTGEEIFLSTGACRATGETWNQDVLMPLASSAKFYNSFMVLKALDERLINLTDPVYYYLPEWQGTYYYYTGPSCTGSFGTTSTAPNWSTFTGALATGSLSEITIGHCMSLNIGFPYQQPGEFPSGLLTAFTAPTAGTPVDWAEINSIKDFYFATLKGIQYAQAGSGPAAAAADPTANWDLMICRMCPDLPSFTGADTRCFLTGANFDTTSAALKLIKSGAVPLMYKVGSNTLSPYTNILQQRTTYSGLPYSLLGACLAKAVVAAGYANLYDYMNQKILTPLDITSSQLFIQQFLPLPAGIVLAENCGRRTQLMANTGNWYGFSADPTQYQAGLDYISSAGATGYPFNACYYISRFPKDAVISSLGYYSIDPYGWNLGAQIGCSFKAWKKIIQLFINKGRYNGKQIISRAMLNWGQNNVSTPGSFFNQYGGVPQNGGPNTRWTALQCLNFVSGDDVSDIYAGAADYAGSATTINPSISRNVFYWAGASGTQWCADLDTGFYALVYDAMNTGLNNSKGVSALDPLRYIQQSL